MRRSKDNRIETSNSRITIIDSQMLTGIRMSNKDSIRESRTCSSKVNSHRISRGERNWLLETRGSSLPGSTESKQLQNSSHPRINNRMVMLRWTSQGVCRLEKVSTRSRSRVEETIWDKAKSKSHFPIHWTQRISKLKPKLLRGDSNFSKDCCRRLKATSNSKG